MRNQCNKRLKYIGILVLMVCNSFVGYSANDFIKKVASRFNKQWSVEQQEKVYVQTDKPYYSAGENIWLKGYLVNATTHLPKSYSRFLYVELIDKGNNVVSRVKIKRDSLCFAGYMRLKPELQAGNYALRAYTYWMQNAGTDFFFKKNIYIGNPIDDYILSSISYSTATNGKVMATIQLTDNVHNPIVGKSVDVGQNWNNPQNKKATILTDKNGKISIPLTIDTTFKSTRVLDVSMSDPGNKYKARFFLPEFSYDYDMRFFPESGSLLDGQMQVIGFKAIGNDGLSVEVSGKIYNSKNEELTDFKSLYKGMGKVSLQVDSGESYYAIVKSAKGIEKKIKLPVAVNTGVALHLVSNRGKLWYEVNNRTATDNGALYLLLHQRGRYLAAFPLAEPVGQITESLLPPGIVSMSVIDTLGNTYCERLHFVKPRNLPVVSMKADKTVYGKREPVNLSFAVKKDTIPMAGFYSLSVTDSKLVRPDSLGDNIMTSLLMTSDLKGYIESPASYFTDSATLDQERLDVLMLTQGWTRFHTADVLKAKYKTPAYYMEVGQTLSGKVMNIMNKPSKKCGIIMISGYKRMIKLAETDSLGRYLIDGIEFPDSTSFALKAKKEKSITDVELIPDNDEFPKSQVFIPLRSKQELAVPNDYFLQSRQKYYTEGGMRVVNLDEVTIKASKVAKDSEKHFYTGMEDAKFDAAKLEEYPGMGVLEILSMMSGVQVVGDQVSIRNASGPPNFYIDDIESFSMDDITYLNSNDIESISVFKGANAAIFGSKGGNGVVAIALKKGTVRRAEAPPSLVTCMPLGYQKPLEFYSPKYEVDAEKMNKKADLRTTVYWAPKLMSDKTGTFSVKFYTADKADNYNLILEGITTTGEICRYQTKIIRKGE